MSAIFGLLAFLIVVGLLFVAIGGIWMTFVKAGIAGWKAIIPIYNIWVMVTEIERPGKDQEILHFVLCLVPCLSFIGFIIVGMGISERFGKDRSFGILTLFPMVFWGILGFGPAVYTPPVPAPPM